MRLVALNVCFLSTAAPTGAVERPWPLESPSIRLLTLSTKVQRAGNFLILAPEPLLGSLARLDLASHLGPGKKSIPGAGLPLRLWEVQGGRHQLGALLRRGER